MGYETYYSLTIRDRDGKEVTEQTLKAIISSHRTQQYEELYALEDDGSSVQGATWYGHEEHMIALSTEYPGLVFELYGKGNNSEDIWYKYFHDGKIQLCPAIITFDEFDVKKLKEPDEVRAWKP